MLTKHLTHTQLPGLTSLDHMYLLALADTVASTKTDFADRFEAEAKSGMLKMDNIQILLQIIFVLSFVG
jgi:hypothetical protein